MSFRGLQFAREYGVRLPSFSSLAKAETALFSLRDTRLARIHAWAASSGRFLADGTPTSLNSVEAWYFEVAPTSRKAVGVTKDDLDAAIGAYFGHVLVESAGFEWMVEEDPFVPGHFEMGVRKGLFTLMLTRGPSPDPLERNKRKQSLFRLYKRYAA
jgi:hypothetical protein